MSIASHLSRKDNRGLYSAAIMECVPEEGGTRVSARA